ncbi:MAG: anion permease [Acidobacteria bacterium]|nr:anion permease [Acidobacteriota bacterium]
MTLSIALLLGIVVVALILFSIDRIPADAVALGVLLALVLTRLLPAREAFAGFGSDTVLMLFGLLVLTAALTRTGVVDLVGRTITRHAGPRPAMLVLALMATAGLLSSFVSNTAAVAFFVPVALGLAERGAVSPSRLLMPLAFASILASSVTLVATSTNLVVSELLAQHGMEPMGLFELTPVGVPILVVGIAYLFLLGRKLIPERAPGAGESIVGRPSFMSELVIGEGSPWIGSTLAESALGRDLDLTVIAIRRGTRRMLAPSADTRLRSGDILVVEGVREEILRIKQTAGIDIKPDVELPGPELESEDIRLAEAVLLPRSPLVGRTLKGTNFRERFGVQVLAIHRHDETIRRKLSEVVLRVADGLLLQGRRADITALRDRGIVRVLTAIEETMHRRKAPLAIGIFVGALALAALEIVSLPVAVLLGALFVFATRCVAPDEAYREIEWRVIVLIGSMLALGAAMQSTGAAKYLAGQIVALGGPANPLWLLAGFFVLTVLLTQPMSNQAAAIVVVPIAIQTAASLGLNPRTFAMMIAVAASCSYLTPLEPACILVYGPGHYRFRDFLKVGGLLTAIVFLIALLLVPRIWPL